MTVRSLSLIKHPSLTALLLPSSQLSALVPTSHCSVVKVMKVLEISRQEEDRDGLSQTKC